MKNKHKIISTHITNICMIRGCFAIKKFFTLLQKKNLLYKFYDIGHRNFKNYFNFYFKKKKVKINFYHFYLFSISIFTFIIIACDPNFLNFYKRNPLNLGSHQAHMVLLIGLYWQISIFCFYSLLSSLYYNFLCYNSSLSLYEEIVHVPSRIIVFIDASNYSRID